MSLLFRQELAFAYFLSYLDFNNSETSNEHSFFQDSVLYYTFIHFHDQVYDDVSTMAYVINIDIRPGVIDWFARWRRDIVRRAYDIAIAILVMALVISVILEIMLLNMLWQKTGSFPILFAEVGKALVEICEYKAFNLDPISLIRMAGFCFRDFILRTLIPAWMPI
jgi:hypothetical protein